MFNKKYEVTLCADKNDVVNELGAMDRLGDYTVDVEVKGSTAHVYTMDNLVFYGFTSKVPAHRVAEMLKKKMYKTKADVVGGTVVLV